LTFQIFHQRRLFVEGTALFCAVHFKDHDLTEEVEAAAG
tara:strand:- start:1005 stop:1121 length:117 start_codon:yes stop_codon:yes gene_type:complete